MELTRIILHTPIHFQFETGDQDKFEKHFQRNDELIHQEYCSRYWLYKQSD